MKVLFLNFVWNSSQLPEQKEGLLQENPTIGMIKMFETQIGRDYQHGVKSFLRSQKRGETVRNYT